VCVSTDTQAYTYVVGEKAIVVLKELSSAKHDIMFDIPVHLDVFIIHLGKWRKNRFW
jgi:hypothetical protein